MIVAALIVGSTGAAALVYVPRLLRQRHLDASYNETFPAPQALAPSIKGKRVLFHLKTSLREDDSQMCVAFNVILASALAGAHTSILFDSAAVDDLNGDKLSTTRVPLRLQKMIMAQSHLGRAPRDYAEYLRLLHQLGAEIYADTDMNVLTGKSERITDRIVAFPFVQPVPWAQVTEKIASSDLVVVY